MCEWGGESPIATDLMTVAIYPWLDILEHVLFVPGTARGIDSTCKRSHAKQQGTCRGYKYCNNIVP